MIIVYIMKSLRIEGVGRTREQWIQIRKVAIQGLLYVGAFFCTYFPGFAIRMMALRGRGLSSEAELFKLLILQSCLVPLQGFCNMLIYVRPTYLKLRKAGASRWKSIGGAWFAPDIPKLLTEVQSSRSSEQVQSPNASMIPDETRKEDSSSIHPRKDSQPTRGSADSTDKEDDSGQDFVEEDSFEESRRVDPPPPTKRPSKPILKSNSSSSSAAIKMDGSISSA